MIAVPQSGPITIRSWSRAYVFSASSSATATLSLNSMTSMPRRRAFIPSAAA
jgi:hypothetical protein